MILTLFKAQQDFYQRNLVQYIGTTRGYVYAQVNSWQFSTDSEEVQINTYTKESQRYPSTTSIGDDKVFVSWYSYGQDGDQYGVFGQLFQVENNQMIKKGEEMQINTYTKSDQWAVTTTSIGDDKVFVSWSSRQDGDGHGVFGQLFQVENNQMIKKGKEMQINTYTKSDQWQVTTTSIGDNQLFVSWHSQRQDGQDGDSGGVFGQLFQVENNQMIKKGEEIQINTYTKDQQQYPSTTSIGDDKVFVSWNSKGQDGDSGGIYGQLFQVENNQMIKKGEEMQINTYTKDQQQYLSTTSIGDDKVFVSWTSRGQDGDYDEVYGKMLEFEQQTSKKKVEITHELDNYLYDNVQLCIQFRITSEDPNYKFIFGLLIQQDDQLIDPIYLIVKDGEDSTINPNLYVQGIDGKINKIINIIKIQLTDLGMKQQLNNLKVQFSLFDTEGNSIIKETKIPIYYQCINKLAHQDCNRDGENKNESPNDNDGESKHGDGKNGESKDGKLSKNGKSKDGKLNKNGEVNSGVNGNNEEIYIVITIVCICLAFVFGVVMYFQRRKYAKQNQQQRIQNQDIQNQQLQIEQVQMQLQNNPQNEFINILQNLEQQRQQDNQNIQQLNNQIRDIVNQQRKQNNNDILASNSGLNRVQINQGNNGNNYNPGRAIIKQNNYVILNANSNSLYDRIITKCQGENYIWNSNEKIIRNIKTFIRDQNTNKIVSPVVRNIHLVLQNEEICLRCEEDGRFYLISSINGISIGSIIRKRMERGMILLEQDRSLKTSYNDLVSERQQQ